jgi:hypothetical protein
MTFVKRVRPLPAPPGAVNRGKCNAFLGAVKCFAVPLQQASVARLSLPKILSGANAFEISNIQEDETEAIRTRRPEYNNVTLPLNGSMEFLRTTGSLTKTEPAVALTAPYALRIFRLSWPAHPGTLLRLEAELLAAGAGSWRRGSRMAGEELPSHA